MVLFGFGKKLTLPTPDEALPGRAEPISVPSQHYVNGNPLKPPFPAGMEMAMYGMLLGSRA
jgi:peptide-methionine (S)-S-oxide reductase